MEERRPQRRKRTSNASRNGIISILAMLFAAMTLVMVFSLFTPPTQQPNETGEPGETTGKEQTQQGGSIFDPFWQGFKDPEETTEPTTEPTTVPTEPFIVSTASVGVTGDVLPHGPVINAAKAAADSTGQYDFTGMFEYIAPYYESYDFMVANLETTLGGPEAGEYRGYPVFNCPDSIIDAMKGAGIDMVLTANNHTYDTGYKGMMRTQQVIAEKGLPNLGTIQNTDSKFYSVQDINGIKVGMVCYTYETGRDEQGRKSLNDIRLSSQATPLVCSFSYSDMEGFYKELEGILGDMEAEGAEASIVYIHWGNEYELTPSETQQKIAQRLCDLGVDVIVGGHPHVVQPFKTLTSESGHTSYCIYSTGNAISNQRRDTLTTANASYTEDGMIFGVEFQKWNDGTVEVKEISILPFWVNKEWRSDRNIYAIIPLDATAGDWSSYDVTNKARLAESYNRTLSLVGDGLNACREALGLEPVVTKIEN